MLKESSGSSEEVELLMTRALQVIAEHCQLRAADSEDTAVDEVSGCCFSTHPLKWKSINK